MFIAHFGAGLAAKGIDRKPSLGTLFLASQFIDLLWPLFLIIGIEKVSIDPGNTVVTPLNFYYYPFSHSLMGVIFWSILFGGIYYLLKKRLKTSLILGVLVLSHWVLDLLVHRPDLPLTTSNEYMLGLSGWNSIVITLLLEFGIFFAGAYLYLKYTNSTNRKGTVLIWSLLIFLVIIYLTNILGPPPPEAEAIGYVGLSQWLIVGWGYWADRNRSAVGVLVNTKT